MQLLRLKVVLAAIDDDESSINILRGAHELAAAANARLHVVHVAPSAAADTSVRSAHAERESAIGAIFQHAGLEATDVSLHLPTGDPAHVIRSLADWIRADVIVLGRHRQRADGRREIGSTALRVVTHSWAPCLILSHSMRLPLERVLAPIDLSDVSRGALVVALSWASALRGAAATIGDTPGETVGLTVLYVDTSRDTREGQTTPNEWLDGAVSRLRDDAGAWASVGVRSETRSDPNVPRAIADYASQHRPDLVVLGTRGVGLDDVGRLGSVSLDVARRIDVPLLLVPPAMWSTHAAA
ncbi:MAG TPA: universal stress protein [Gemmatimonadaceae bacterium]|nr:universal stress protein [Gemmatimonadaceae bacterium]